MNFVKKNLVLVIIALLAVVGGGFFVASQNETGDNTKQSENTTSTNESKGSITVTIKNGDDSKSYTVEEAAGLTAWEVLQKAVGEDKLTYKDYGGDMGIFIESISGVKPLGNNYWKFVVNGKDASVGVSSYEVKVGDKLEWVVSS